MPVKTLNQSQLSDAKRLKEIFTEWQTKCKLAGLDASQAASGDLLGIGQSAVNQYLNGKIPLNVDVAAKFASLLSRPVHHFSVALAEDISNLARGILNEPEISAPVDSKSGQNLAQERRGLISFHRKTEKSAIKDALTTLQRAWGEQNESNQKIAVILFSDLIAGRRTPEDFAEKMDCILVQESAVKKIAG